MFFLFQFLAPFKGFFNSPTMAISCNFALQGLWRHICARRHQLRGSLSFAIQWNSHFCLLPRGFGVVTFQLGFYNLFSQLGLCHFCWTIRLSSWQGNTDPDQVLIWTQPHCELVDCLDPMPIPSGYTKQLDGSWSCSDGDLVDESMSKSDGDFLTDFWSQTFVPHCTTLYHIVPEPFWSTSLSIVECWPTGPRLHWCGGWLLWFWQHLYAQVRRLESCQPRIWHWKLQKSWPIQWNCMCELGKGWRSVAVIPPVPVLCLLQMSVNLCGALVHSESIEIQRIRHG